MGTRTPSTPKPGTQAIRGKKAAPRDLNVRIEIGSGKGRIERAGRATLTDDTLRFRTGRTGDQGADFRTNGAFQEGPTKEIQRRHGDRQGAGAPEENSKDFSERHEG